MTKNTRFSPEVRQRAVRMVLESQGEYDSQWAAICSIAPKIGCTPETLRVWVRQHERDTGSGDGGLTTAERQRLKELERENRELRRSNDILRQASAGNDSNLLIVFYVQIMPDDFVMQLHR
ncbi:transposase, partial [Escherichia coli]|uniref:transposase n=1 Tax=Escherichia coli TaxID=562 RepID=UPI00201AE193